MPRIACKAVTTSASDQSGTASRIACSRRSTRSFPDAPLAEFFECHALLAMLKLLRH
jgi:hypothetical protein